MKKDQAGPSSEDKGPSLGDRPSVFLGIHISPSAVESPQSVPKCRDALQERRGHGSCPEMKAGSLTRRQGKPGEGSEARARCHHNSASWCIGRVLDT